MGWVGTALVVLHLVVVLVPSGAAILGLPVVLWLQLIVILLITGALRAVYGRLSKSGRSS